MEEEEGAPVSSSELSSSGRGSGQGSGGGSGGGSGRGSGSFTLAPLQPVSGPFLSDVNYVNYVNYGNYGNYGNSSVGAKLHPGHRRLLTSTTATSSNLPPDLSTPSPLARGRLAD